MAHDVFISYSAHDKPAADAVCAKLESRGIRCWIAPRDIRPGMSWGGAIVEAIDGARVMMLLFSSHANDSPQIKREVERAVHKEIVVVPVRVEDVKPTGDFEYFLGTPHWLDAISAPFEQHLEHIADSAGFWLERGEGAASPAEAPRPPEPARAQPVREEPRSAASPAAIAIVPAQARPAWIVPSIAALVIALIGTAGYFGARYYADQQELAHERAPEHPAAAQPAPAATAQVQKAPEPNAGQAQQEGAPAEAPASAPKAPEAEAKRKRLEEADAQVDRILNAIRVGIPAEAAGIPDPASVSAIRAAAEAGGREQQRRLGGLYVHGLGVPQDDAQAFNWMSKSAAQGEPMAEFILGTMYQRGRGVDQDPAVAVSWFRKSAAQGNAFGENSMGIMYADGRGVPKDLDEAIRWYRKAADQGMPEGEANLGFMYRNGWGVPLDFDQALRWFRKAAEQGNGDGEFGLGVMYQNGSGVPKDYGQALGWYRKAADRGNPRGEFGLGVLYQHGWGVPRDLTEAEKWYRKSAAHGNPMAKKHLNRLEDRP
jgi:TPR repeat protein